MVNRNTGFAHMTRGVNMYPLIARMVLHDALQEAGAPERRALKDDPLTERERRSIPGLRAETLARARCRRSPWPGSRPA